MTAEMDTRNNCLEKVAPIFDMLLFGVVICLFVLNFKCFSINASLMCSA